MAVPLYPLATFQLCLQSWYRYKYVIMFSHWSHNSVFMQGVEPTDSDLDLLLKTMAVKEGARIAFDVFARCVSRLRT
jgi:hypothetical protein